MTTSFLNNTKTIFIFGKAVIQLAFLLGLAKKKKLFKVFLLGFEKKI